MLLVSFSLVLALALSLSLSLSLQFSLSARAVSAVEDRRDFGADNRWSDWALLLRDDGRQRVEGGRHRTAGGAPRRPRRPRQRRRHMRQTVTGEIGCRTARLTSLRPHTHTHKQDGRISLMQKRDRVAEGFAAPALDQTHASTPKTIFEDLVRFVTIRASWAGGFFISLATNMGHHERSYFHFQYPKTCLYRCYLST